VFLDQLQRVMIQIIDSLVFHAQESEILPLGHQEEKVVIVDSRQKVVVFPHFSGDCYFLDIGAMLHQMSEVHSLRCVAVATELLVVKLSNELVQQLQDETLFYHFAGEKHRFLVPNVQRQQLFYIFNLFSASQYHAQKLLYDGVC